MINSIKGLSNTSLNSIYSRDSLSQFLVQFQESIESSFDKILEFKIKKTYRLEDNAKILIFENFLEIVIGLCTPKLPSSIAEVDIRLRNYSRILSVMKPSDEKLEVLKSIVTKGKKNKLCLPHEKLLSGFKNLYGQFDVNVMLYVLVITENIVQTYIDVGYEYQMKVKNDDERIIWCTTMQIIFSRYNSKEEKVLLPIYSSISKLTNSFSQNYTDNIKKFVLFLRDSREQLDILIKVFKQPLDSEEKIQKVFGNIEDVMDSLSLVVDTLDVSMDSNRKYMALDLMDLAEMEMFTPFKTYANAVVVNNCRKEKIDELLKTDVVADKLVSHYNSMLGMVFAKCSQKRCLDLMIRYRIVHQCEYCRNPLEPSRFSKTIKSMSSPSDERRSVDSGYEQLSSTLEHISSGGSSVTSNSDSLIETRGSSPMNPDATEERLKTSKQSIKCNLIINCYRYLLPRLLLFPIFQFLFIYQILDVMSKCQTESNDEKEEMMNLDIVVNMLRNITFASEEILSQNTNFQTEFTRLLPFFRLGSLSQEYAKESNNMLANIKNMVKKEPDNWEWPSGGNCEFIMEGPVQIKINSKKKYADRYLYLFSNMLLICKKQVKKSGLIGNQVTDLKLKHRISLEQFHVIDDHDKLIGDNEDFCAFTLEYLEKKDGKQSNSTGSSPSPSQKMSSLQHLGRSDQWSFLGGSTNTLTSVQTITENEIFTVPTSTMVIYLSNPDDKIDWMASLLQLQTKKIFSQYVIIKNIEEIPLKLPDISVYRFAEPDSEYNIEYESSNNENSGEIPVIRAATIEKLITHLTYHAYFDGKALNSFLLIFRNFTTADELLDLLIERFNIPDPVFTEAECRKLPYSDNSHADRILKKFRMAYKRKMQLRVVNFVTKWINNAHYFKMDFANNPKLLEKLQVFLNQNMVSPHIASKIKTVKKNINNGLRDSAGTQSRAIINIDKRPPVIPMPLCLSPDAVSVVNIHPLELARQITLFEWRLYSKIEFWEVNGREKQDGPNFSASIDFSNKILYWLIYEIMKHKNLHDRVAAILRVADLMQIFESMNNLQGAQECKGALISASVYRLKDTFDFIAAKHKSSYRTLFEKLRNDYQESSDSYIAQYQKKIYNISAPGLPYIAMGDKTQLIHMNLKNPNYFIRTDPRTGKEFKLVNFWKFRQMSELIQHYLSFQNTPYNFHEQPLLQTFLQELDIFKTVSVSNHYEFDDFAHENSLLIQPRFGDVPSFPDRELSPEEIKMTNILNSLSIKDKVSDSPRSMAPDSPPTLPPKGINIMPRKSATPEPVSYHNSKLPPVPERPQSGRRKGHEHSLSQSSASTSDIFSHSPSTSDQYSPFQKGDSPYTRPPPIPSRSGSRDSKDSPPLIPPRLPPLPPKNSDTI